LPDERKVRPTVSPRVDRPPVATRGPVATVLRPPHDPTHPGAAGPSRPRGASRPEARPPAQATPSGAGTTRMPAGAEESHEPTTRISAARDAATNAPTSRRKPETTAQDREIESWLSELRSKPKHGDRPADIRGPGNSASPSAGSTHAMPESSRAADSAPARPVPRPGGNDSDPATERLNTPGHSDDSVEKARPRRRGGLSAQELLRREGRF
jgi:hypothetical protein